MRKIEIDATADESLPDQGRILLFLLGVQAPARLPILRLRPLDPTLPDTDGQWPDGDLLASEVRVLEEGIEIVIGPEIAECPALLPGTAVEIEFPELRLRGDFLWPRVALTARPRRRSVVAKRASPVSARPQQTANRERPNFETALSPPELATAGLRPDGQRPAPALPGHVLSGQADAPAALPPSAVPRSALPPRHQAPATSRPNQEARPLSRGPAPSPAHAEAGSDDAADQAWEEEPRPTRVSGPAVADRIAWQPGVARPMAQGHSSVQPAAVAVQPPDRAPALPWSPRTLFGFIVGTVLAIEAVLFAVKGYLPTSAGADPSLARTRAGAGGTSDPRLSDVLQTPSSSPRGIAANESNPAKLLALANASLHAPGGARDADEGAYWLKRYIVASLGEDRMLRALTQLGSSYAEPAPGAGAAPDYARARQLWEFAASFGDPVAMCFLGALHEHGLGVSAEKKAALHWYARAKSAGGCPQLEESIARVMP